MRKRLTIIMGVVFSMMLFACATKQKNILETGESQVKLRSMQSRVYDTADRDRLLRTIIATLQDLGFVIDDADQDLGTVSGTKRSGYSLRMTVSIRPRGEHQSIVRSNAQYNLITVEDPEPYQAFFSSLSKALFLEAHLVGSKEAAGGGRTKVKTAPKETKATQKTPQLATATAPALATKAPAQSQQKQQVALVPKEEPVVRVGLRRKPVRISNQTQITDMLLEYDFFDSSRNAYGAFANNFVDNKDGTITDKATGLMWQRGGSSRSLDTSGAKNYLKQLNRQRFAGYADWRMPTVEELASLLVQRRKKGVHLAPVFENNLSTCWTADECDTQYYLTLGVWIVNFKQGQIQQGWYKKPSVTANFGITALKNDRNFVKAVRSVR